MFFSIKKPLSAFSVLHILMALTLCFVYSKSASAQQEQYTKTFKISAYYSPLPCQSKYVTGTFEGDKRLNGNGTNGADGTEVYPGMLAAPKTFPFGTKMYIPGLGYGTVHDRGGAIVASNGSSNSFDRLDVWMGYGDEGLTRALRWGKRNAEVTVYGVDSSILDDFYLENFTTAESIPKDCPVFATPNAFVSTPSENTSIGKEPVSEVEELLIFPRDIHKDSSTAEINKLQNELNLLNYFKGDITGIYDEVTVHAVFKFQQSQNIVLDYSDPGAGYCGQKTRSALNEIIKRRNITREMIANMNADYYTNATNNIASNGFNKITKELEFGMTSTEVKLLQSFLAENGFISSNMVSGFFGENTKAAVIAFQIKNNIISSQTDLGAGRIGPKTLSLINEIIS